MHLGQAFLLVTLVLTQHAIHHALSVCGIGYVLTSATSVLVLAVPMHTLNVKVAAIETICKIVNVVK